MLSVATNRSALGRSRRFDCAALTFGLPHVSGFLRTFGMSQKYQLARFRGAGMNAERKKSTDGMNYHGGAARAN
jgi:hypothetical protein